MNNWTIIIYYIYALAIILLTGYAVFILNHSGWYWLLAIIFLSISPTSKKD